MTPGCVGLVLGRCDGRRPSLASTSVPVSVSSVESPPSAYLALMSRSDVSGASSVARGRPSGTGSAPRPSLSGATSASASSWLRSTSASVVESPAGSSPVPSSCAGSDFAAGADSSGSAMSNREPPSGISVPGVEVAPPAAGASFVADSAPDFGSVSVSASASLLGGDVRVGVVLAAVDVGVGGGVAGGVLAGRLPPVRARTSRRCGLLGFGDVEQGAALGDLGAGGGGRATCCGSFLRRRLGLRLRLGLGDGLGLALGGDVRVGVVLAAVHLAAGLLDLRLGRRLLARRGVVTAQVEQGTATEALVARLVRRLYPGAPRRGPTGRGRPRSPAPPRLLSRRSSPRVGRHRRCRTASRRRTMPSRQRPRPRSW